MIDRAHLTRHERGVILAALRQYEAVQTKKARTQADAKNRAMSGANAFVASDLLRQLTL